MNFKIGDIVELDPSYDSVKKWREYNNIEYGKKYVVVDIEIEPGLDPDVYTLLSVINDNGEKTACVCSRFKYAEREFEPDCNVQFY